MSPNRGIGGPMARQLSARAMGENRSGMPGEPLGKERKRETGEELRAGDHDPDVDSTVQSTVRAQMLIVIQDASWTG